MEQDQYKDYLAQAIMLAQDEKYEAAKNILLKVLEQEQTYEVYMHLGNISANLKEFDNAIKYFKYALNIEPEADITLFSMGNVYLMKDDYAKALEYYNKADALGCTNPGLFENMAGVYFESGEFDLALRYITRAIDANPVNGKLRLFKVRLYLALNKVYEALEALDEMRRILPDAYECYDYQTQILVKLGKYEEAISVADEGNKRFPDDINLSFVKLRTLVDAGKAEAAFAWIQEMKNNGAYEATFEKSVFQEATLFLKKQDAEGALKLLIDAEPKFVDKSSIEALIMDICSKTAKYDQVLLYSEKAISAAEDIFGETTARYFHALALKELGRTEESDKECKTLIVDLRKATIRNPNFYEGFIFRLLCHTQIKEYDKALEITDYIESLYPEKADAFMFRHYIYKQMGDEEKAADAAKKVKKIRPDFDV